jgi:uncharacterized protein (TIGR02444 family)
MAYGRPGVAGLCVELQDQEGQSVALLLWAAWARPDDPAVAARACDLARTWEATAIGPLRAARRGLRPPMPPIPDSAREVLRAQVQAVELAAERVLLETLEALGSPGTAGDPGRALVAVSAAWGRTASADRLAALAAALG